VHKERKHTLEGELQVSYDASQYVGAGVITILDDFFPLAPFLDLAMAGFFVDLGPLVFFGVLVFFGNFDSFDDLAFKALAIMMLERRIDITLISFIVGRKIRM
jgi:hypothetical protein